MYNARYLLNGQVVCGLDGISQAELTIAYEAKERPRCLCVRGGAEMYIAKHGHYVIKRMPGTAPQHHPSCDSYEPEASVSGRGAMLGTAIISTGPESFEVHVDFPLARASGRIRTVPQSREGSDVNMPAPRLTLQALMHFLFEQAGFHRWSPSMAGRRSQGVVHKYLTVAASEVRIKGGCPVGDWRRRPRTICHGRYVAILGGEGRCRRPLVHPIHDECG